MARFRSAPTANTKRTEFMYLVLSMPLIPPPGPTARRQTATRANICPKRKYAEQFARTAPSNSVHRGKRERSFHLWVWRQEQSTSQPNPQYCPRNLLPVPGHLITSKQGTTL